MRTREHVLADLSVNHLERYVLLAGHTLHRVYFDYGYDLAMFTYGERGEAEPGFSFFQVKATDQLRLSQGGKSCSCRVSRRNLRLWLGEAYPVTLVVYDGQKDKAYWLYVQRYFANGRPLTYSLRARPSRFTYRCGPG